MNNYNNNGYDPNSFYSGYDQNGYGGGGMNTNQINNPYMNRSTVSLSDYTRKVYGWMFVGLAITFAIALAIVSNPIRVTNFLITHIQLYYILAGVELLLVFCLGFFVTKLPPTVSLVIFFVYAAVNGLTIAPILLIYQMSSVISAFAVTGCVFGAMSIYGMVTKRDLSGIRPVLIFGLLGLLVYSLIAMIFHLPMSDLIISLIGIALFIGFTAYDTQKIKQYYLNMQHDDTLLKKGAIVAALNLYLDFINLFLYILRLFGRRN